MEESKAIVKKLLNTTKIDELVKETDLVSININNRIKANTFLPNSYYKKIALVLDNYGLPFNSDGSLFFRLNYSSVYSNDLSTINIPYQMKYIIGMRLGPLQIPLDNYSWQKSTYDDMSRWTVCVDEFKNDSFNSNDYRYHFITEGSNQYQSQNKIETSINNFNNGEYWFDSPILPSNSLTLRLGNGMHNFKMQNQSAVYSVVQRSNPMCLNLVNSIGSFQLNMGDEIFITRFNTGNPTIDSTLINSINNRSLVISGITSGSDVDFITALTNINNSISTNSGINSLSYDPNIHMTSRRNGRDLTNEILTGTGTILYSAELIDPFSLNVPFGNGEIFVSSAKTKGLRKNSI
jgi:hypothetical protein